MDISDQRRRAIHQVLPTLRLGKVLGHGAGGCVVAADDDASGASVALKVLADDRLSVPYARQRLRTEADVLTRCRHPNVIEAISFHERDDMLLLVMERVDGVTVLARQHGAALTVCEACDIVLAAARGLQCVHQHGYLHGDIKPENVLFDPGGRHRLVDFGLATRWPFKRGRHVVGTPGYMAREAIVSGGVLLPATDVYALGVMAYELLAGHPPFLPDVDPIRAVKMHVDPTPIPLMVIAPQLPRALADLVMTAIAPDVADRVPSAGAFADRLTSAVDDDVPSRGDAAHRERPALRAGSRQG